MTDVLASLELSTFLIAIIAGILIGIPAGPARFFVVDTSLKSGKTAALKVYAGFFASIIIYAAVALLADDFISRHKQVERISYFVASLVLIFWGIFIILRSHKNPEEEEKSVDPKGKSLFLKGFTVGLSNPVTAFIYLALIQVLKIYSEGASFGVKAIFLLTYELISFLTTWVAALLVIEKKTSIRGNWRVVKIVMGILLILMGGYNAFSQLEIENGIRLKEQKNFIERGAEELEVSSIDL